ncbi:unnamed protein product [Clavelina lepadiformis]|uniref:Uncharacterized protein n=1 Tax=Clavelina lepadiformis TaxID=159417 RepID=A0ABP0GLD4_CLALP
MSTSVVGGEMGPASSENSEPDEYNLYLGFMIPIGAILALCVMCLFVISWQLICPKCSRKYCPKMFLESNRNSNTANAQSPEQGVHESSRRRTSLTLVRRHSDFPPSYEQLISELPPSYHSVVIIEEEAPPGDRSSRSSGIRTYVYDPSRRISIEIHDEDTIRVVEELLSRRRSTSLRRSSSLQSASDPPGYSQVIHLPERFPTIQASDV